MRSADHCYTHYVNFNPENENLLTEKEADKILIILKDSNADLRRGDLISTLPKHGYRNEGIAIYDGVNIINLSDLGDYDYGCVPKQFKVIQEFSINYWSDNSQILDITKRGIDHNNIIWFDHNIVKDQCIMNITHKIVNDGKFGIITQFIYNTKIYYIVLDDGEDGYEEYLENNTAVDIQILKEKLLEYLNSDCIVFESQSQVYLNPENNILFTSPFFRED